MTRFPETLGALVSPHYRFTDRRVSAVVGQANGKLYLLDAGVTGALLKVADDFSEMYPSAIITVRNASDWENLPIAGDQGGFYDALGCEWVDCDLPFSGFYQSYHGDEIDRAVMDMFTGPNGDDLHGGLYNRGFDRYGVRFVESRYASAYVEAFACEFGLHSMIFCDMTSPSFYNFETDRIFAKMTVQEWSRVRSVVDPELLDSVAIERHTSRSGFISFYSPEVEEWGDLSEWDDNQRGTLIRAYRDTVAGGDFDQSEEFCLVEDLGGNGHISDWIWQSMDTVGKRLAEVACYLRARAERGDGYEETAAGFDSPAW